MCTNILFSSYSPIRLLLLFLLSNYIYVFNPLTIYTTVFNTYLVNLNGFVTVRENGTPKLSDGKE